MNTDMGQETTRGVGAKCSLLRSVSLVWATWVSVVNLLFITRVPIFLVLTEPQRLSKIPLVKDFFSFQDGLSQDRASSL